MRIVIGMVAVLAALAACKDHDETTTTSTPLSASAPVSAAPVASASAPAEQPEEEQDAIDQVRTHHRHHHFAGVAMFVHMAIDSLGVSPDKKAQLEKIQSDLHTAMKPARDAHQALLGTLADGIAAGTIDKAKVTDAENKVNSAAMQVHAASIDALNALHAALSPAERQTLAQKVDAHFQVWKKVNVDEQAGAHDKGTHLEHLTEALSLTPDQVDKLSTALNTGAPPKPDIAPAESHVSAFVKAFPGDTFDAKTLTTANAGNGAIAKHGTARMVRFYEVITPLLNADQRTKLATHVRERANDGDRK